MASDRPGGAEVATPFLGCGRFLGIILAAACLLLGCARGPADDQLLFTPATQVVPVRYQGQLLAVDVRLGRTGEPHPFVLDSGSPVSGIELALARRLKLPLEPATSPPGSPPQAHFYWAKLDQLRFGETVVARPKMMALDLGPVSQVAGFAVEGVIGYSALRQFAVELDYEQQTMTLYRGGLGSRAANLHELGWSRCPMELAWGYFPVLRGVQIEGSPPLGATLDTGYGGSLELSRTLATSAGLHALAQGKSAGAGYFGKMRVSWVKVSQVTLEQLAVYDVVVHISEEDLPYRWAERNEERLANIGNGLLSRFTVILDYPEQSLFFWRPGGR